MIVSFHKNIICAGREPGADDLAAIKAAAAVVLPQGCRQSLYEMASDNCKHVFPNYRVRFNFPGKIGQIRLFRETGWAHPPAELYPSVAEFKQHYGEAPGDISFGLPCVFKFDWGGEGETVYLINSPDELREVLEKRRNRYLSCLHHQIILLVRTQTEFEVKNKKWQDCD